MDRFLREIDAGEIHQRDQWQFELKSEFLPLPGLSKNYYTQEFFIFIPNSLQINEDTYTQAEFYESQTNLIRYKTPEFTLKELSSPSNGKCPLSRLKKTEASLEEISDELKLLGNIFRSSLRERIRAIIQSHSKDPYLNNELEQLTEELKQFRTEFYKIKLEKSQNEEIKNQFLFLDEFISNTALYYLTGLLVTLKKVGFDEPPPALLNYMTEEEERREKVFHVPRFDEKNPESNEYILYRSSLLNKYVIDALLLETVRSSLESRFRNLIGSLSAGVAMLFFFVLFVWQGEWLLFNSMPFILATVVLYILKDRIKEGLRVFSYRQFSKWFYDYNTDIRSPDDKLFLGKLGESVSFVKEDKLPKEIKQIRAKDFHKVLIEFQRPEQAIYYKRRITLFGKKNSRRSALNTVFRFNIEEFLKKADDPYHTYLHFNASTQKFDHFRLPKVYHINVIMRTTYRQSDFSQVVELKKFRLIVDKNGIKRVEQIKKPEMAQGEERYP